MKRHGKAICFPKVKRQKYEKSLKKITDKSETDLKTLSIRPYGRQRGRVVRAPDLKFGGRGFKSRSDH